MRFLRYECQFLLILIFELIIMPKILHLDSLWKRETESTGKWSIAISSGWSIAISSGYTEQKASLGKFQIPPCSWSSSLLLLSWSTWVLVSDDGKLTWLPNLRIVCWQRRVLQQIWDSVLGTPLWSFHFLLLIVQVRLFLPPWLEITPGYSHDRSPKVSAPTVTETFV